MTHSQNGSNFSGAAHYPSWDVLAFLQKRFSGIMESVWDLLSSYAMGLNPSSAT